MSTGGGMSSRTRAVLRAAAVVLSAIAVSGCAASTTPGSAVASRFYRAVDAGHWGRACALLAPETKSQLEQSAGRVVPGEPAGSGAGGIVGRVRDHDPDPVRAGHCLRGQVPVRVEGDGRRLFPGAGAPIRLSVAGWLRCGPCS